MSVSTPKLILHSNQSQELTSQLDNKLLKSLTGKKSPKITYIPSCSDPRKKYFKQILNYYENLGYPPPDFFDPLEDHAVDKIESYFRIDVIHLSGGAVNSFFQNLVNTGCDIRLRNFAARGGVILGVSAGAMLLGKTYESARLVGEKGPSLGLGFYDFEIVPHFDEVFPSQFGFQKFVNSIKKTAYGIKDGGVLVVHGQKLMTYGVVVRVDPEPSKIN